MPARRRRRRIAARALWSTLLVGAVIAGPALTPSQAVAFNPLKPICKVAQLGSGAAGKACTVISAPGKLLSAGRKLISGHVGGAVHTIFGGSGPSAAKAVGLAAIAAWVLGGAKFALQETAKVLGHTTNPQLRSAWFSTVYWRIGGIAALLTLPFLFAAAVHAMLRGDIALLTRAAFGYLPLAMLAVAVAAPLTMLLLAAADECSAIVGAAGGHAGSRFLALAGAAVGGASFFHGSPFMAFLVGLIAAAGALVLWLELLLREACVYIVVLMLPLAFAAMVWPPRRILAVRGVELLVALILAKFAIVVVLALGGEALGHDGGGTTAQLAGAALVLLGAFAPWALLRVLPLTELASAAAGSLRPHTRLPLAASAHIAGALAAPTPEWARELTTNLRQFGDDGEGSGTGHAAEEQAARLADLDRVPIRTTAVAADRADGELAADASADRANPEDSTAGVSSEAAASSASGSARRDAADDQADATTPDPPRAPTERSPGMEAMWQAPDFSWRPLVLGLDEWPPPPLWEPGDPAQDGTEPSPGREPDRASPNRAGADPDPLPPPQASDDGVL